MCVSNRILQASGSVAVPALQPRDVLVTLDEYSRIIDSTNRGTSNITLCIEYVLSMQLILPIQRFLLQLPKHTHQY